MKIFKTKKYSIISSFLKYSFIIIFVFTLITPILFVHAGGDTLGTNITTTINNPLGENGPQDIPQFIKAMVKIVLTIGIPIVVLALIYVGFLFVKAQGNSEELTKAKKALIYTLIGAALLLGAYVIADAIGKTVQEIGQ
jgi:TM2 domain-containing membrane protein YozV